MADLLGVYFFFALFCGVPDPADDPYIRAAWVEMPPQVGVTYSANAACYIGRDPGFPVDGPGSDPVYLDTSFSLGRRVNPAMVRSETI